MAFITNYLQNTAAGYLTAGVGMVGNMAGNAVGGVGSLVESAGRGVGEGVNGGIRSVGSVINGYGDKVINATAPTGTPPVNSNKKVATVKPPPGGAAAVKTNGSAYTKKALPANSSKAALVGPAPGKAISATKPKAVAGTVGGGVKALPAGKTTISAASRPKTAVTNGAGGAVKNVNGVVGGATQKLGMPKTPVTGMPKTPLTGMPKTPVNGMPKVAVPKVPSAVPAGKVKISAASRPKTVKK